MNEIPDLPALSIRQPWAWLILHAGKRLENRDWSDRYPPIKFRGEFLIHAASGMTQEEFRDACEFAQQAGVPFMKLPFRRNLDRGGIVGRARVVGWTTCSESPWFMGPGALVLDDVKPLPFVPCKGMLGFFRPKLEAA